jgi:hypothetical protein
MFAAFILSAVPGMALAYIGPGAGLSAIGGVISLLGAVVLLIVGFVWYPVKRLLRRRSVAGTPDNLHPDEK